ncbi:MAG: hypothetical protein ACXAD7_27355, partial [Candidatus Kariarchaeaceae archaeon]
NLTIEFEDDRIEIETVLRTGTNKNKIEFEIRNNSNGLEVGVEYTPNYNPQANTTEIELEFEITFREIVEYVDINQNNVFDESTDNELQVIPLEVFETTQYSTIPITVDTDLHYFIVKTTDGIFTAHIYISEEFEIINNSLITPSETKIAIELKNFNYTNPNSRLALYTKLEASTEYEEKDNTEDEQAGYTTGEKGVFTTNVGNIGFFTWEENATIDGISKRVFTSEVETDDDEPNEQKIYLNYPKGTTIFHDPKIGIEGLSVPPVSDNGTPTVPGYATIAFLGAAILGILIVLFRFRQKKPYTK